MDIRYNKDSRFVFAGDGITAADRASDPDGVGFGYVRVIRDYLYARHAPVAPVVLNRALSRGGIQDVATLWSTDVIAARPDVLSIMIDVERPVATAAGGPPAAHGVDEFRAVYRQILADTRRALPKAKIILNEPPALWSCTTPHADEVLRPYVHAIAHLGEEFRAVGTVPVHSALTFLRRARPEFGWMAPDGRLSSAAHAAIAYTWLEEAMMISLAHA